MLVRPNFAEGKFYPDNKYEIIEILENALQKEKTSIGNIDKYKNIIGGVVPHAGYIYCSRQAVHFFEIVKESEQQYDVVIIINPNHHGKGLPASVDDHEYWSSPFGNIAVDHELADKIGLPKDKLSQSSEHSGEVIVPYIQYFMGEDIKILPISFGAQNQENAKALADAVFKACVLLDRKPLFIASSDFNHFATPEKGKELDDYALEALMNYDCTEFERRVKEKSISICGFGTIMALFYFAQKVSAHFKIEILAQGHSGEAVQMDDVVDYVSMIFYEGKEE